MIPDIATEYVATIDVEVSEPLETGHGALGNRRLIPIVRGHVKGPKIDAVVLEGGADSQIVRPDGSIELSARYMFKTVDGAVIYVENNGIRRSLEDAERLRLLSLAAANGSEDTASKVQKDAQTDVQASVQNATYFRTAPRFETAHPGYRWLTNRIHVATAVRFPDRVLIHVYRVL
ncbi:DUF3237 domain-containing protein [Pararobbsia silviterrae]|uniref:DUF3237 domain-containing protein n=1 Tax=Pararobbsia silviterrae TaxID=1792498 RepID=UPI001314DC53|nr:DUF3237 domain-containing protein [Pararobbsia silviterrae]